MVEYIESITVAKSSLASGGFDQQEIILPNNIPQFQVSQMRGGRYRAAPVFAFVLHEIEIYCNHSKPTVTGQYKMWSLSYASRTAIGYEGEPGVIAAGGKNAFFGSDVAFVLEDQRMGKRFPIPKLCPHQKLYVQFQGNMGAAAADWKATLYYTVRITEKETYFDAMVPKLG